LFALTATELRVHHARCLMPDALAEFVACAHHCACVAEWHAARSHATPLESK
jgi:hypothetical protein